MPQARDCVSSPVGDIILVCDSEGALCALDWRDNSARVSALLARFHSVVCEFAPAPAGVIGALRAYFEGESGALDDLPVRRTGTEFQWQVWQELRRIPPGKTLSYRELARRIGRPDAIRAVGAANAANPVSLVIPCHRLVGANGSLAGYAGGLERKQWLLDHEARHRNQSPE